MTSLVAEARKPSQQVFPMIKQSVVDPDHQVSFIGPVPNFNPQILSLVRNVSQRQFFAVYPLLNIECNSPASPTLPIPSKKAYFIRYNT